MVTIGSIEARDGLLQLLERVANGEQFTITDQGKPVAKLVPADPVKSRSKEEIQAAVDAMIEFRKGRTLGEGVTIRDLIEEGRRR